MKKVTSIFVLAIGLLSLTQSAMAAPSVNNDFNAPISDVEVNVNGEFIATDVHPIVKNNHTFLPIRTLASLGLSYNWDATSKVATVQNKNGDELKITLNNKTAYKNEKLIEMELPAESKDGRVIVPVRFVTEALGCQVQYESIRNIIFITSGDYQFNKGLLEQDDLQAARLAAISLPIISNFKTLEDKSYRDQSYFFPGGRADAYMFYDGYTNSVVEIKDGKAILDGQWVTSPKGDEYLAVAGKLILMDDPILKPMATSGVQFSRMGEVVKTTYWENGRSGEGGGSFTSPFKIYSNLIQPIPDQL